MQVEEEKDNNQDDDEDEQAENLFDSTKKISKNDLEEWW